MKPTRSIAFVYAEEHKALVEGRPEEFSVVGPMVQGGLALI